MDEFLKQYHFCDDLTRLNNQSYFQENFTTDDISKCITNVTNLSQYKFHFKSIRLYFYNLKHTLDKDVFIIAKWLVGAHQMIRNIKYPKLLEDLQQALGNMGKIKICDNYELYLHDKLIKPYLHYLQKLTMLEYRKLLRKQVKDRDTKHELELWFIKYNLTKYLTNQFPSIIMEFKGFLKQSYPYLGRYSKLIETDLQKLIKEFKQGFRRQDMQFIDERQLHSFEEAIEQMNQFYLPSSRSALFTESQVCPSKLNSFMFSGSKQTIEGKILIFNC